jgi:hypothetical protein
MPEAVWRWRRMQEVEEACMPAATTTTSNVQTLSHTHAHHPVGCSFPSEDASFINYYIAKEI